MDNLEPCPFCGGKAFIGVSFGNPYVTAMHRKGCVVKPNTWLSSGEKSLKKQIKAWNRRTDG